MVSSDSSSSSSDEDSDQLKEAVDSQFLKDELYDPKKKKKIPDKSPAGEIQKLPSLRPAPKEDFSWNPYNIRVTPEFRNYVSKQLTRVLDQSIDDSKAFQNHIEPSQKPETGGIRLLSTSKKFVNILQPEEPAKRPLKKLEIRKRKCDKEEETDSSEEEKRVKEAAVTPEWVLSKEETKHWAPSTKGEVEVIQISPKKKKKKKKKKEVVNGCEAPITKNEVEANQIAPQKKKKKEKRKELVNGSET